MPAPQALLSFPGLQQIRRWSYTLSHGITPGVAAVEIVPQFGIPPNIGTLEISFGQTRMQFRDCLIDWATVRRTTDSGMVVSLSILDRRWRWRFGEITGRYNVRRKNGKVDFATEKKPQDLATLLFRAMGESGFSVNELPNLTRPEVEWVSANPAAELASLCESLGCRIVLGLDNRAAIRRTGFGAGVPNLATKQTLDFGVDPPLRPDSLKIVGGATRFQTKFLLEAVGEEADGEIVPIDDLSYAPTDGWANEAFYGFGNVADETERQLAQRHVFRTYRIKCTSDRTTAGAFSIPGLIGSSEVIVEELWQLLPLERGLIETYIDRDEVEQPGAAYVEGIFQTGGADAADTEEISLYGIDFQVDTERGFVSFPEPVYRRDSSDNMTEAELYLTIAHGVKRLAESGKAASMPVRYESTRTLSGKKLGTGPHVIFRDDIVRTIIGEYQTSGTIPPTVTGLTTNDDAIAQESKYYLDAAQNEYQTLETLDVQYAGIVPIQPDGAIQQVSWAGGLQGGSTRAGRNTEFSKVVPSWKERRAAEGAKPAANVARKNAQKLLKLAKGGR